MLRLIQVVLLTTIFAANLCCSAQSSTADHFRHVASYRAFGGLMATAIAPGPAPGSQWVYASYLYADSTFDVIAVNPKDGTTQVFHNPVSGEFGARNLSVAPNGDVYFGTLPHAHFMRLDWATQRMIDLGRPSAGDEYIWDTTFGPDGKLYGVTYPECRLVRYDPADGKMADLGRMDPTEKYGRWIVNGRDGYLYIGIGTAKADIAVYDTRSGKMREVLPPIERIVGIAKPYLGTDGKVYATVGDSLFRLSGFTIEKIDANQRVPVMQQNTLSDGRTFSFSTEGFLKLHTPNSGETTSLHIGYNGEPLQIFRITSGSDGVLYGSAVLPAYLVRVDISAHTVNNIGLIGGGEVYSLLEHHGRIALAGYSSLSVLMSYDPTQPFHPGKNGNPSYTEFEGADEGWRPQAMIEGPRGLLYIGGTAGYGKLEGPIVVWDGKSSQAGAYGNLIHNQSLISLATWQGQIVGGTTTEGGGGSHPTEKDATVFFWNPTTHKVLWKIAPVPGAKSVTDLITSRSGLVYGVAFNNGPKLFTIDPKKHQVLSVQSLPFHSLPYNGVVMTQDGTIWGLAEEGIFQINDSTHQATIVARSPVPITGGIALQGHDLYFVSNSEVYSYDGIGR